MLRIDVLGIGIDCLNMEETVKTIAGYVRQGEPRRVVTANPEMVYKAISDPGLKQLVNSADLVTADGEGIVWAARYLGHPVPGRVTGIDLLHALLPLADQEGWRIFLLGAAPGVAAMTSQKLNLTYRNIHFADSHGYFRQGSEEQQILAKIKEFAPQLLLVGLGAGRQEQWIAEHLDELGIPVALGVGGSFDVLSGNIKRAPAWVQHLRVEWLYRLVRQPWRLKRQLDLPKFVIKIIQQKYS